MTTIAVGRAHLRRPIAFVALVAAVFVIATLVAVFAALLIGTRLGLGIGNDRLTERDADEIIRDCKHAGDLFAMKTA